jgi:hypothetical protein
VRFGRKLKLTAHQRHEAVARRAAGEALVEIGRSYNVSHSTISRPRVEPGSIELNSDSGAAQFPILAVPPSLTRDRQVDVCR